MARIFGEIAGFPEGTEFPDRPALTDAGVHRPPQGGISGGEQEGADSIVVSGGYEDEEDYGDVIIYTGHGGRDPATGKQIADQELTRGNLALAHSCVEGLPVRVIRGKGGDPAHAPGVGYRFDGLYMVEDFWSEPGASGYRVCRYRLRKLDRTSTIPDKGSKARPAHRIETTVQRIVRTTAVTQRVKEMHDHTCQVCGTRLETAAGPYAEGAHIRGLGRPHDGPDTADNLLCLCANCHVLFDRGAIALTDALDVVRSGTVAGRLRTVEAHSISADHVRYHRTNVGSL